MDHMNHSHHMDHDHSMMGMKMFFHTSIGGDYILFEKFKPSNEKECAIACVGIVLLSIFYEVIKFLREYLLAKQSDRQYDTSYGGNLVSIFHWIQSVLHAVQYFVSYCLMLIAMTYQVYFFASILVGAAIGFLIFNPLTKKIQSKYQDFNSSSGRAVVSDPCCG